MHDDDAYDDLGPLYDAWCAEVTEDLPFYGAVADALAAELGRPLDVIELGAGSGRVTVELARRGHSVLAIDRSAAQLDRIPERAESALGDEARGRIDVRCADMVTTVAELPDDAADLVVAPFRSLLHVSDVRDELFADVARVLRPGGTLAFDVFHPSAGTIRRTHGRWLTRRSEPTATGRWEFAERAMFATTEDGATAVRLDVSCTWQRARRRVRAGSSERGGPSTSAPEPPDGEPAERLVSMLLVAPQADAWRESIERAGLVVDGAYGWFDARPLDAGDEDSAWVARRP